MSFELARFRIDGLHGYRSINIPFKDNTLVLVGENGTGKTTIANFICFFLSRTWNRMVSYEFDSVALELGANDQVLALTYKDIFHRDLSAQRFDETRHNFRLSPSLRRRINQRISRYSIAELLEDNSLVRRLSFQLRIPDTLLYEYLESVSDRDKLSDSENLKQVESTLRQTVNVPVLYLPTYRRIERDLQHIFPSLDLDEFSYRRRLSRSSKSEDQPLIELVEFGMEDVSTAFEETMDKLKESLRKSLNDLTGTYLREVIQGEYESVDSSPLLTLEQTAIDAILDKVGENLLPDREKSTLRDIVDAVKKRVDLADKDKVIVHFLVRLVELHRRQEANEQSVVEFITVCNRYLADKALVFDNKQFEIHIDHLETEQENANDIEVSMLSSGEKQIVSLFAHMYLSQQTGYFVVIDEPELSLSVDWQRKFLPDILATDKCSGLVAVTHSPYVFDNALDEYAHDVKEFWVH